MDQPTLAVSLPVGLDLPALDVGLCYLMCSKTDCIWVEVQPVNNLGQSDPTHCHPTPTYGQTLVYLCNFFNPVITN